MFHHEHFLLRGYPLETVLAEKLTTMLALGDLNTRDRDWADVWRLTGKHDVLGRELLAAAKATASHRRVHLQPLSAVVTRLPQLRQAPYAAWRRTHSNEPDDYPAVFLDVVNEVIVFADPVLSQTINGQTWRAASRIWRPA